MTYSPAVLPRGIYTPFLPFHHKHDHDVYSRTIDIPRTLAHISHLAESGITGLIIPVLNEKSAYISHTELVSLIRSIRAHLSGLGYDKFIVIVATGVLSVRMALEQIDEVKGAGADFALVIPPKMKSGMCVLNGPAVMGFIHDVAQSSSLPMITYNSNFNSANVTDGIDTVGVSNAIIHLTPPTPRIVGWKSACPDTNKLGRIAGIFTPVPSFCSSDFILPALEAGAPAVVVSSANIVPRLCVRLYNLYREGYSNGAKGLQSELSRADETLGQVGDEGVNELIAGCYGGGGGYGYGYSGDKSRRISRSSTEIPIHMSNNVDSLKLMRRLLEFEDGL
ncbi:hypothetical protein BDW69DRAFT_183132 [Aspergillus filifer]